MPKYVKARPFDLVREFLQAQKDIHALKVGLNRLATAAPQFQAISPLIVASGWADRNASQAQYAPSSFWIEKPNKLHLNLSFVVTIVPTVATTLIFTLPSGFIPNSTTIVPVETDLNAAGVFSTGGTPCFIIRGSASGTPGQVQFANPITHMTTAHNGSVEVPMGL